MREEQQASKPLVAVLNTSLETIEMLVGLLEDEDYRTVTEYITNFKRGSTDITAFFTRFAPDAVIYDIALPYEENWQFFNKQVLGLHLIPDNRFVLTTTNKRVLEQLVGPTPVIEMLGKPFDMDDIRRAVKKAIQG